MPFSRMREDVSEAAVPFAGCGESLYLNTPTPDGFLHTWAPLPADMTAVVESLFPNCPALSDTPTVGLLKALTLSES
jgi:hypothetical protein